MSTFLNVLGEERPRMDVPASKKGRDYHKKMTRADRSSVLTRPIQNMRHKAKLIDKAYNDDIWTQEDIDTFMLDESMNTRNRVMFGFNMVKPVIEQFRGTAIQSTFNASVQPVTKRTALAKQRAMGHMRMMHSLAEMSPELRRIIGAHYNLGDTMAQTVGMMENRWEDRNIRAMNHLLEQMVNINEMGRFRSEQMMRFVISGMYSEIARADGSHLRWYPIHEEEIFWDTTARRMDLSDASFHGTVQDFSMPKIAEMWNIDAQTLKDIEDSIRAFGGYGAKNFRLMQQTKIPVTTDYWTDVMYQEFGYVNGPGGVPLLVRVGDREDGYKQRNAVSYNDLIDPPDTEENEKTFRGNKTRKSFVECTHFCEQVLWEDMAGVSATEERNRRQYDMGYMPDLVLDYGIYELQEYNPYDIAQARSPIKHTVFAIANGDIVSPLQAVLSPNRFVNRVLSALEGQMNQSGGKAPMVDMDLVDPALDENEVNLRIKQSRLIPFRAMGRGIGNAIGAHDSSPGAGAYAMLNIVQAVQDLVRNVTGVNASFAGEAQKNQLVGVTDVLVQRGALMMEPVHDAMADFDMQQYRFMVTAGKEFYLQRLDVLLDMISEEDLIPLYQSRDFEMERYNATVVRDNPEQTKRKAANAWLDQLLALGLIDRGRYANLINRSYVEDIAPAIREYTAELAQAGKEAERQQAKDNMLAGLAQQSAQLDQDERDAYRDQAKNAQTLAKVGAQGNANNAREALKAELAPVEQEPTSMSATDALS